MAVVKENIITIRPTRAGFMKLQPIPPNSCFARMMAAMSPTSSIHTGIETGTLNATSMPVTTADRSETVTGRFISFS